MQFRFDYIYGTRLRAVLEAYIQLSFLARGDLVLCSCIPLFNRDVSCGHLLLLMCQPEIHWPFVINVPKLTRDPLVNALHKAVFSNYGWHIIALQLQCL